MKDSIAFCGLFCESCGSINSPYYIVCKKCGNNPGNEFIRRNLSLLKKQHRDLI